MLCGFPSLPLTAPHLQELVQRCGLNPKYTEVAREEGGAARVHVEVNAC